MKRTLEDIVQRASKRPGRHAGTMALPQRSGLSDRTTATDTQCGELPTRWSCAGGNALTGASKWTVEHVGFAAIAYVRAQAETREAKQLCYERGERFLDRRGTNEPLDTADPAFRKYTNKQYTAYRLAKQNEYNALRRMVTAVRNSSAKGASKYSLRAAGTSL